MNYISRNSACKTKRYCIGGCFCIITKDFAVRGQSDVETLRVLQKREEKNEDARPHPANISRCRYTEEGNMEIARFTTYSNTHTHTHMHRQKRHGPNFVSRDAHVGRSLLVKSTNMRIWCSVKWTYILMGFENCDKREKLSDTWKIEAVILKGRNTHSARFISWHFIARRYCFFSQFIFLFNIEYFHWWEAVTGITMFEH